MKNINVLSTKLVFWMVSFIIGSIVQSVSAQSYPTKSIRLVVGFASGGPNDMAARIVGHKLTESLGVPVIIDNRPGANSMIGMQITARAVPDGYTIAMISASATSNVSASATANPNVFTDVSINLLKDFTSITLVASGVFVLIINPSLQVRTVKDLILLAKDKPGQLNFASAGLGSSLHLAGELFKSLAHVDINHVPYKGGAPAVTDVVTGQVQMMFSPLAVAMPHVRSSKLIALAVTSAKRSDLVPELPTISESGVPGYEATGWYGIIGPAGLPNVVLNKLNREIVKSIGNTDVKKQFAKLDLEPIGNKPEEMKLHLQTELVKWAKVVKDAKL